VSEVREAAGDEDAALVAVEGSLFTARVDPQTSARPGAQLRLAVDPARFHYFDPETGFRLEQSREPLAVARSYARTRRAKTRSNAASTPAARAPSITAASPSAETSTRGAGNGSHSSR